MNFEDPIIRHASFDATTSYIHLNFSEERHRIRFYTTGRIPLDYLGSLVHEFTHYWFADTPIFHAIRFQKIKSLTLNCRATPETGQNIRVIPSYEISDYLRWNDLDLLESLLSPIIEGAALLAEFNLPDLNLVPENRTSLDSLLYNVISREGCYDLGIAHVDDIDNDVLNDFYHKWRIIYYNSKNVHEKKIRLLSQPIHSEPHTAGHALGYLYLKEKYIALSKYIVENNEKTPICVAMFLNFMRWLYFFDNENYEDLITLPDFSLENTNDSIIQNILNRIQRHFRMDSHELHLKYIDFLEIYENSPKVGIRRDQFGIDVYKNIETLYNALFLDSDFFSLQYLREIFRPVRCVALGEFRANLSNYAEDGFYAAFENKTGEVIIQKTDPLFFRDFEIKDAHVRSVLSFYENEVIFNLGFYVDDVPILVPISTEPFQRPEDQDANRARIALLAVDRIPFYENMYKNMSNLMVGNKLQSERRIIARQITLVYIESVYSGFVLGGLLRQILDTRIQNVEIGRKTIMNTMSKLANYDAIYKILIGQHISRDDWYELIRESCRRMTVRVLPEDEVVQCYGRAIDEQSEIFREVNVIIEIGDRNIFSI